MCECVTTPRLHPCLRVRAYVCGRAHMREESVHVFLRVCACVTMCMRLLVNKYAGAYVCVYVRQTVSMSVCESESVCLSFSVRECVRAYVCVYVRVYVLCM